MSQSWSSLNRTENPALWKGHSSVEVPPNRSSTNPTSSLSALSRTADSFSSGSAETPKKYPELHSHGNEDPELLASWKDKCSPDFIGIRWPPTYHTLLTSLTFFAAASWASQVVEADLHRLIFNFDLNIQWHSMSWKEYLRLNGGVNKGRRNASNQRDRSIQVVL